MTVDSKSQELRSTDKIRHGISVKVDLNTKYFFENQNKFDISLYSSLEEVVFEVIKNKSLEDYLKGKL